MSLVAIKSARRGATTTHAGIDTGWSSVPLCPALQSGKREVTGGDAARNTVNCRPCIKIAREQFLDIDPLVFIGQRLRGLIEAVRTHAIDNYDEPGAWDLVVECYSDADIAEVVRSVQTRAGAVRKMARELAAYADRRAYHQAEIAAATGEVSTFSDPQQPEAAEYDRFAEGPHPDGSVVVWHHDPIGGESWGERHWPGKACRGDISIDQAGPEGDYVERETYTPAWRGVHIESPNHCWGLPF